MSIPGPTGTPGLGRRRHASRGTAIWPRSSRRSPASSPTRGETASGRGSGRFREPRRAEAPTSWKPSGSQTSHRLRGRAPRRHRRRIMVSRARACGQGPNILTVASSRYTCRRTHGTLAGTCESVRYDASCRPISVVGREPNADRARGRGQSTRVARPVATQTTLLGAARRRPAAHEMIPRARLSVASLEDVVGAAAAYSAGGSGRLRSVWRACAEGPASESASVSRARGVSATVARPRRAGARAANGVRRPPCPGAHGQRGLSVDEFRNFSSPATTRRVLRSTSAPHGVARTSSP